MAQSSTFMITRGVMKGYIKRPLLLLVAAKLSSCKYRKDIALDHEHCEFVIENTAWFSPGLGDTSNFTLISSELSANIDTQGFFEVINLYKLKGILFPKNAVPDSIPHFSPPPELQSEAIDL